MTELGSKIKDATVELIMPSGKLDVVVALAELTLLVCAVVREVGLGGRS